MPVLYWQAIKNRLIGNNKNFKDSENEKQTPKTGLRLAPFKAESARSSDRFSLPFFLLPNTERFLRRQCRKENRGLHLACAACRKLACGLAQACRRPLE